MIKFSEDIPKEWIICRQCYPKKIRLLKTPKDLNIHLKLKHKSEYKIHIADNSAMAVLRTS